MTLKRILAFALAVCCVMTATACGGDTKDDDSKTTTTTTAAQNNETAESQEEGNTEPETVVDDSPSGKLLAEYPVNDGAYDVSKGATENMLARAILNRGDTSRLAQKVDNALNNPKEVTKICFLGDSITAGSGANSSSNQYVNQVKTWWEENVSYYLDVTNAGIGATDSYCGVHRAFRDCLSVEADIIFIEFINDAETEFYGGTMESLVRMCLAQENNPAVILIEPSCEGGSSPQSIHLQVAQKYDIPMISFHDAVIPEIDAGNFKWSDISPDNVHPNDYGHIIMAQCITNLIGQIKDNIDSEPKEPTAFDTSSDSLFGDRYAGATLGGRDTTDTVKTLDEGSFTEKSTFQKFMNGWGTTTGGTIEFEVTAKNIGMLYMKTVDGKNGTVAVTVDDGDAVLINGDFPGGWGNYAKADPIYESDEAATHKVKVEVLDGDEAQSFQILNWLLS